MSLEIVFLRGAEADLLAAFTRYENRLEGLGEESLIAIDGGVTLIGEFPEIAPVYHLSFRRLVVSRFPFGIFYAIESDRIVVHAVLDLRQAPEKILKRLK